MRIFAIPSPMQKKENARLLCFWLVRIARQKNITARFCPRRLPDRTKGRNKAAIRGYSSFLVARIIAMSKIRVGRR